MDARQRNRDYTPGLLGLAIRKIRERGLQIQMPTITEVAETLHVSRQTVYAQTEELARAADMAFLEKRPGPETRAKPKAESPEPNRTLSRETALELEVRTYERDHDLQFAQHEGHLEEEHRSFLVLVRRKWLRLGLSKSRIAEIIGIPREDLRRWDEQADATGSFPKNKEKRGAHNKLTFRQIREIVEAYEALEEDVTLQQFYQRFNNGREDRISKRKISRVLQAHAIKKARVCQHSKLPPQRFRVYFPGAQMALDGKKLRIQVDGKIYRVTSQTGIDIASGLFLGNVIATEETAEGTRTVIQLSRDAMDFLSVLMDNRSGNRAALDACDGMAVGPIFTFYYRPQTNGHLEGGKWSWFERAVGKILEQVNIDTSSPEAIAQSVAKIIMEIFAYFSNRLPRKSLDGMTPLEYARSYKPTPEEAKEAREGLGKQKERSERIHNRKPHLAPEKRSGIEALCQRWSFDTETALRYLGGYDTAVILETDRIYAAYMRREGFDEDKKTLRYFCGIARRLQRERDDAAQNARAFEQRAEEVKANNREKENQIKQEEAEEQRLLQSRPEKIILDYLGMFAPTGFRWFPGPFKERISRALRVLRDMGRAGREQFKKIMAWVDGVDCPATHRERVRAHLEEAFGGR